MKNKNIIPLEIQLENHHDPDYKLQIGPIGTNVFDRELVINTSILKTEVACKGNTHAVKELGQNIANQLTEDEHREVF